MSDSKDIHITEGYETVSVCRDGCGDHLRISHREMGINILAINPNRAKRIIEALAKYVEKEAGQ